MKIIAPFYTLLVILKYIHPTIKMAVDLGKDLKLACEGVCWKGFSVSQDVVGLVLVIQNQMESFNTRCGWVWLLVHLVGV